MPEPSALAQALAAAGQTPEPFGAEAVAARPPSWFHDEGEARKHLAGQSEQYVEQLLRTPYNDVIRRAAERDLGRRFAEQSRDFDPSGGFGPREAETLSAPGLTAEVPDWRSQGVSPRDAEREPLDPGEQVAIDVPDWRAGNKQTIRSPSETVPMEDFEDSPAAPISFIQDAIGKASRGSGRGAAAGAGARIKAPPIASQVPPPLPEEPLSMAGEFAAAAPALAAEAALLYHQARSPAGSIGQFMTGGSSERRHDSGIGGIASAQAVLAALNKIGNIRSRM